MRLLVGLLERERRESVVLEPVKVLAEADELELEERAVGGRLREWRRKRSLTAGMSLADRDCGDLGLRRQRSPR